MKKAVITLLALSMLVGALGVPALAGKKKGKKVKRVERTVEVAYTGGGIGIASPAASGGACPFREPGVPECIEIPSSVKEKFVAIEIKDATGLTVAGFISQGDVDGDGVSDGFGSYCGKHEEAVALTNPGTPVRVSFYPGVCDSGSPSLPTTGTIVATFSNLP